MEIIIEQHIQDAGVIYNTTYMEIVLIYNDRTHDGNKILFIMRKIIGNVTKGGIFTMGI